MATKKTVKKIKEIKKPTGFRIRPSVAEEAKKHIELDDDVKSFNDFLENAVLEYNAKRRKLDLHPENPNQAKLDL